MVLQCASPIEVVALLEEVKFWLVLEVVVQALSRVIQEVVGLGAAVRGELALWILRHPERQLLGLLKFGPFFWNLFLI